MTIPVHIPPGRAATQKQMLTWEKDLLGLYVSGHPLDEFREKLSKQKLDLAGTKANLKDGTQTVVAGCVETKTEIVTKKGDKMAFVTIMDMKDKMEIVVFPKILKDSAAFLESGKCILIKGTMSARNGEQSFIADAIMAL